MKPGFVDLIVSIAIFATVQRAIVARELGVA